MPYVITNMDFVHVQNVPPELRSVKHLYKSTSAESFFYITFRDDLSNLQHFQKLTEKQKVMAYDLQSSGQADDCMSSFSIRPPELLCVQNVELFYKWFVFEHKRLKVATLVQLFLEVVLNHG